MSGEACRQLESILRFMETTGKPSDQIGKRFDEEPHSHHIADYEEKQRKLTEKINELREMLTGESEEACLVARAALGVGCLYQELFTHHENAADLAGKYRRLLFGEKGDWEQN